MAHRAPPRHGHVREPDTTEAGLTRARDALATLTGRRCRACGAIRVRRRDFCTRCGAAPSGDALPPARRRWHGAAVAIAVWTGLWSVVVAPLALEQGLPVHSLQSLRFLGAFAGPWLIGVFVLRDVLATQRRRRVPCPSCAALVPRPATTAGTDDETVAYCRACGHALTRIALAASDDDLSRRYRRAAISGGALAVAVALLLTAASGHDVFDRAGGADRIRFSDLRCGGANAGRIAAVWPTPDGRTPDPDPGRHAMICRPGPVTAASGTWVWLDPAGLPHGWKATARPLEVEEGGVRRGRLPVGYASTAATGRAVFDLYGVGSVEGATDLSLAVVATPLTAGASAGSGSGRVQVRVVELPRPGSGDAPRDAIEPLDIAVTGDVRRTETIALRLADRVGPDPSDAWWTHVYELRVTATGARWGVVLDGCSSVALPCADLAALLPAAVRAAPRST